VVGDHRVIFAGPAEAHRGSCNKAEDRMIFARAAAVHAALCGRGGKKPGLYSMADVLGLGDV